MKSVLIWGLAGDLSLMEALCRNQGAYCDPCKKKNPPWDRPRGFVGRRKGGIASRPAAQACLVGLRGYRLAVAGVLGAAEPFFRRKR